MLNRSILNRSILKDALRSEPGCLTLEELEKLAETSTPNHSHLAGCTRCQAELALLKSFESSEPAPGEGAAVAWISARLEQRLGQIKNPRHRRAQDATPLASSWLFRFLGTGKLRWAAPLAAVLVIVITSLLVLRGPREPQLRADAGNGPSVYRSLEVEVSGPSGDVPDAPVILQWKAVPGASLYKILVTEVDDTALWAAESRDLQVTIPQAARAKMLPGKPVLWRVTALDGQGRVLAASQVQRFSVHRKSPGSANEGSTSGIAPR